MPNDLARLAVLADRITQAAEEQAALVDALRGPLSSGQGIIIADDRGCIQFVNEVACQMLRYPSPGDLVDSALSTIIPLRYRERHRAGFKRVAGGGKPEIVGVELFLHALPFSGDEVPLLMRYGVILAGSPPTRTFVAYIRSPAEPIRLDEYLAQKDKA